MMYWNSGIGGWGMALMTVSNLLFWGGLIAGVVMLVRYLSRAGQLGTSTGHRPTPEQVLADRFARGEIDDDEYARRLQTLGGAQSQGAAD